MSRRSIAGFKVAYGAVTSAFILLALASGFVREASAQQQPTGRDVVLDSVARRVRSVLPVSGPSGTAVTLGTAGLPAITPLRIGIGATHFGFEDIGQVMTDPRGEFELTVHIPTWVRREVTYRFIVFDFYFRPIALSDPFHATDADGAVIRKGTVGEPRATCRALHGDDDVVYALIGETGDLMEGDRVTVEARLGNPMACGRGTALEVISVKR